MKSEWRLERSFLYYFLRGEIDKDIEKKRNFKLKEDFEAIIFVCLNENAFDCGIVF